MVELLNAGVEQFSDAADKCIVGNEAIELMSVNREMTLALVFPNIALIHRDAYEMRHDLGKAVVVVPFYPDNFNFALAVGELADLGEEHPVIAVEPAEVEIGEDVAEKNEAAIGAGCKKCQRLACPADIGTEVEIREEQRVVCRA